MSESKNYSVYSGELATIFLAWVLTYFIAGPPHWIQVFLFWLWVVPLIILVIFIVVAVIIEVSR